MAALQTGWLNLTREGKTWSGRKVTAEEIHQMVSGYNTDLHTAIINYRHYHGYKNLGKVIELRAIEDEQGKVRLQGRLEPNKHLYALNLDGQDLHFSVEIAEQSPETGEAYLYGLAMTDDPDSMGTSELKLFSNDTKKTPLIRTEFESIHLFDNPTLPDNKKSGWFSKYFSNQQESAEMNEKQLKQFTTDFLQGMQDGFESLEKSLVSKFSNKDVETEKTKDKPENEQPWEKALSALTEQVESLTAENEKLHKLFSTPKDSTDGGDDDGGDDDVQGVI